MALKLLDPAVAQQKSKRTLDADKHRLIEVQTLITQKYKELGVAEASFADALKNQRTIWATEEERHRGIILSLGNEVEALEERKKQALIPLTKKAEDLDTKASALASYKADLDKYAAKLDEERQLLANRLDEVAERELQADSVAKTLKRREEGISLQAGQITRDSANLATVMASVGQQASDKEQVLNLKKAALTSREVVLAERERKVNEKEAGFATREKALADERYALTQAAEELKKKYGTR